jgi:hypothetical protein
MKVSVLYAGLARPHAGWVAIDELAQLLVQYFGAEDLSPKLRPGPWPMRHLRPHKEYFEPLDTSGGDILMVAARGPGDLALIRAIPNCRKKFQKIFAFVTDSYFEAGFVEDTALYDAITVTAHEDVAYPRDRFGIPVFQLYQGIDALTWAPRATFNRDIDIIGFGRTPPSYQKAFAKRFHAPASEHLYLHSPLGNLAGPNVHLERGMLFKLLQRSRISLAFHLMMEPQGNRPRSMMVTSRWLESLVSGCVVVGKRPVSRMADDMLCWSGATIELSDNPEIAADEIEGLLGNNDAWLQQRQTNIANILKMHDWRYRIRDFCELMQMPAPTKLKQDLARIAD